MATAKPKKPTNKLKAGKSKKVNKWLLLAGVAVVAVIGVVVVRYSGASSNVWSIRSSAVKHSGGKITVKNGVSHWVGTKGGEYVKFVAPAAGTYCMEGKYLTKDMIVSSGSGDGKGHGAGGSGSIGNQTTYKNCYNLGSGHAMSMGIVSNGTMEFHRVRKQ